MLDAEQYRCVMCLAATAFLDAAQHLVRGRGIKAVLSAKLLYGFALLIQPLARLFWGS